MGADFFYSAPFSKSLIRLFKLVFGLCKVAIDLLPAFCIFTLQKPAVNRKSFSLPLHHMKENQLYVIVLSRFYVYAWLRSPLFFLLDNANVKNAANWTLFIPGSTLTFRCFLDPISSTSSRSVLAAHSYQISSR